MALASVTALAAPAQGARYAASVQLRESPTRIGSVSGFGKEVSIVPPTTPRDSLFATATYSGPGRTTRRGMFGRLCRLGSVALRFQPEGKPSRSPRPDSCTGGPKALVTWRGTFRGSIRLDPGAHLPGFARTGKFTGQIETVPRWHCRQTLEPPTFDPGAGGINVDAFNCEGRSFFGATVEVDPATPPPPPGDGEATPADFSASWTKSVGIARVSYSISAEGGADTAVFSDDLSEGTIKPPSPFHGQATLRRQGESWEWSGSLSARFPGRTVRLTGPGFEPFVTTFTPRPHTAFLFAHAVQCVR